MHKPAVYAYTYALHKQRIKFVLSRFENDLIQRNILNN